MKQFGSLFLLCIILASVKTDNYYSGLEGNVVPLSSKNWANQVVKARTGDNVIIIHFFKSTDGQSYQFSENFKAQALKTQGIFKFGGVSCDDDSAICAKEGITEFPSVKIYPPLPMPPFIPEQAGLDVKRITAWASGYVPSNVEQVNDDNVNGILNSNPSVPKVLLLTNKDKTPLLWKAISNAFKGKLFIGIAKSDQSDVIYKFNPPKFPFIVIQKTGERRPIFYEGKLKFQDIFDFLNVFSEQFVPGGGESSGGPGDKPWLNEAVPEFFDKSANDVCLGEKKVLCVIFFNNGKPADSTLSVMKEIRRAYDNKIGRSVSFRFMWSDISKQTAWVEKMEIGSEATIIILNPGRRKRYLKYPGVPTSDSLNIQLEKILGGDSRFTALRPNELPKLN